MFGEGVALRAAFEELGLESAFERRYAPRDGGVVGAEASGGDGQAARTRDREKKSQIVPVEPAHPRLPLASDRHGHFCTT